MKVSDVIKRLETEGWYRIPGGKLMRYAVVIEKGPTSYGAYVPDLSGCLAVGKSAAQVKKLIAEAVHSTWRDCARTACPSPRP
jgi:hypothetical protein